MEFFHEYAEEVAPNLAQAFTAMLNSGATSAFINKGLITLIPKTGDRAKLSNWRPITLLQSPGEDLRRENPIRTHPHR
jgi:hypothetical protein